MTQPFVSSHDRHVLSYSFNVNSLLYTTLSLLIDTFTEYMAPEIAVAILPSVWWEKKHNTKPDTDCVV